MVATKKKSPVAAQELQAHELRPVEVGRMTLEKFMQLRFHDIRLDGKDLTVTGSNGTGKTSILLSILATFGLVTKRELPEPILHGEDKGSVSIELIDAETHQQMFTLTRSWSIDRDEPEFLIERADGSQVKHTKDLVNQLIDPYTLTPTKWLSGRPQDQVDDVLRICKVPVPVAEVEEITGRHHPIDGDESAAQYLHRLSADKTGTYYVERHSLGQIWEQKRKALDDQKEKVESLPQLQGFDGADMEKLLQERAALDQRREQARALKNEADKFAKELADGERDMAKVQSDVNAANERAVDLEKQIAALQIKLQAERETIIAGASRIAKGQTTLGEIRADYEAALEASKKAPDPTPQILELDSRITDYERRRHEIAKHKAARDRFDELRQEEEEARGNVEQAGLLLERIRGLRRNLLNGVKLPVEGLAIGDGELLFNGKPFMQASTAQRKIVALSMGILRNPLARFMVIDEGENFDVESEVAVREFMQQHSIQRFEARVEDQVCPTCKGDVEGRKKCAGCKATGRVRQGLKISVG